MESHNPARFGGHEHYGSGDVFSLSHDLVRPRDQRVEATQGLPSSCQVWWS